MAKCRYVPKLVDIDGAKDFMIRKVIEKDAQKEASVWMSEWMDDCCMAKRFYCIEYIELYGLNICDGLGLSLWLSLGFGLIDSYVVTLDMN